MSTESSACPSTAIPFSEAVRRYATSPFLASLPQPFPGVNDFVGHFPKGMAIAERKAMASLQRDLFNGALQAWGRAKSPLNPLFKIPADAWRHLSYLNVVEEKLGLLPARPETSVWNVRVDVPGMPDRKVQDWEYLDIAALIVTHYFGRPVERASDEVAAAVFGGCQFEVPPFESGDLRSVPPRDREAPSVAGHEPPGYVRLGIGDRTNPSLYHLPIARPGDVVVSDSRIVPGYDLRRSFLGAGSLNLCSQEDVVYVNVKDLLAFISARMNSYELASSEGGDIGNVPPFGAASEEKRCEIWLQQRMQTENKLKTKSQYREEAMRIFAIGSTAFERAWRKADQAVGAGWSRPGRFKAGRN